MKTYEEAKIVANAIGIISTMTSSSSEKLLDLISGFCFTKKESEMIKAELTNSKCGFDIDRHWEETNKGLVCECGTEEHAYFNAKTGMETCGRCKRVY